MADNNKAHRNWTAPQKARHFLGAFLFMGISKYSLEFKKNCVETIIRDFRCEQSPVSGQINKRNPTSTRLQCGADKTELYRLRDFAL